MPRAVFSDRAAAGAQLGTALAARGARADLVLGLPRGGMVVAAGVAAALDVPLDVWLVRKLGHPRQPELALGALSETGAPVWADDRAARAGVSDDELAEVVVRERTELDRRRKRYRGDRAPTSVSGLAVVLVDDGLATGSTALAAVRSLRAAGPARVLLAAPVASREAVRRLSHEADEVVVLATPSPFRAVGSWYQDFSQTGDDEVIALLGGG